MLTIYNKNKFVKKLALCALPIYIIGVLYFTLLWKSIGFISTYNMNLNLIPFYWLIEPLFLGKDFYMLQVILNIVLFIPLGILLPLLFKSLSFKKMLYISFLATLSVELIQPFFNRCTDIDDIILNSLGGIIGYMLLSLFVRVINRKKQNLTKIYILPTVIAENALVLHSA